MKRALYICLWAFFFPAVTAFAQDGGGIPPVDASRELPSGIAAPAETLLPSVVDGLYDEMSVDIPAIENLPQVDAGDMRDLHRKLLDELPRYPVLPLWSGQYAHPFIYSSRSRFSGLDMAGIGTTFHIAPWLSADVSAYLSGAYLGHDYPRNYMNASLSGTLRIKVHDRVNLIGMGEISAREGLHPRLAPGVGGKNSLGAGVEIFITEKFGITISRSWEYYRGSWYGHNNYGPIQRQGRPR